MLVIRESQMESFRQLSLRRFEDQMVGALPADYPQKLQPMSEAALRELVRKGIRFAHDHGIDDEGGVAAILGLVVQFGEAFESSPDRGWAMQVLGHESAPGPLKVELLVGRMAARAEGRVVQDFFVSRDA